MKHLITKKQAKKISTKITLKLATKCNVLWYKSISTPFILGFYSSQNNQCRIFHVIYTLLFKMDWLKQQQQKPAYFCCMGCFLNHILFLLKWENDLCFSNNFLRLCLSNGFSAFMKTIYFHWTLQDNNWSQKECTMTFIITFKKQIFC